MENGYAGVLLADDFRVQSDADADDCVDAAGWRQGAVRAARDVLHTRAGATAAVDDAYAGALLADDL